MNVMMSDEDKEERVKEICKILNMDPKVLSGIQKASLELVLMNTWSDGAKEGVQMTVGSYTGSDLEP